MVYSSYSERCESNRQARRDEPLSSVLGTMYENRVSGVEGMLVMVMEDMQGCWDEERVIPVDQRTYLGGVDRMCWATGTEAESEADELSVAREMAASAGGLDGYTEEIIGSWHADYCPTLRGQDRTTKRLVLLVLHTGRPVWWNGEMWAGIVG